MVEIDGAKHEILIIQGGVRLDSVGPEAGGNGVLRSIGGQGWIIFSRRISMGRNNVIHKRRERRQSFPYRRFEEWGFSGKRDIRRFGAWFFGLV